MENLKKVLLVNSISSGATGILLAAIPGTIAELFNSPVAWPFTEVGIFLIVFAIGVYYASSLKTLNISLIKSIIVLDVIWVAASLLLVFTGAFNLSALGYVLTTAVAGWVALMAYLQTSFLNKALPENRPAI